MGHAIDDLNYNKVFYDAEYVWSELKKLYGPATVTEDARDFLKSKLREGSNRSGQTSLSNLRR